MQVRLDVATPEQAMTIAAIRNAAADDLTVRYGRGLWSPSASERGVLFDMRRGTVYLATWRNKPVATLILSTRKPWAIDRTHFSHCRRPLYLTAMAVAPDAQRRGIGRACLTHVERIASEWPADAIRLDAWDAQAGAGEFYRKCGYAEVGHVTYRTAPLIYFERLL